MGSVLGLLLGAAAMLMINRNHAYMMQCYLEAGGAYAFAKEQFGYDHGFLTAWFLKTIANRDAMTGVKHKNAFLNSENEINMAIQRYEAGAFAVVVCDVNGLKYINDNFEHKAGGNYNPESLSAVLLIAGNAFFTAFSFAQGQYDLSCHKTHNMDYRINFFCRRFQ